MGVHKHNSDHDFEAEDDARTIARAAEIKADGSRMKKASAAAKTMVVDQQANLNGLKRVAKMDRGDMMSALKQGRKKRKQA